MSGSPGRSGQAAPRVLLAAVTDAVAALQGPLAAHGYAIEPAPAGAPGQRLPNLENFDLALLEVSGQGADLSAIATSATGLQDTECIVLAGQDQDLESLSRVLGERDYQLLGKTCGTDELVAAMRSALRRRQLRLENRTLRARLEEADERNAAERLANFQAQHDLLTRLPNRALLDDRLGRAIAQAQRTRTRLAVMFVDLDGFKAVNDRLGHDLGDRLLRAVAERLQGCVRQSDTLARFGGDEFALLLPGLRAREDAAAIAGKVVERLGEPFVVGGHRLSIGASIGIAMYPEAGELGETLVRRADIAMYHVKGQGKNGFHFYTEDMDPGLPGQLATERELRGGLVRGEIEIYYRPRVHLATRRLAAVEAMWRWQHPKRGLVEAADIAFGFATGGYVREIEDFLHTQAFRQTAEWRRGRHATLCVAVKLPVSRLARPGFVEHFTEKLHAAGLDEAAVIVEVEENGLMEGVDRIGPRLQELASRGVRVVVGEFGAGFSSWRYLERLAIDGLKLSGTLVRELLPDTAELPFTAPVAPKNTPGDRTGGLVGDGLVGDTHRPMETGKASPAGLVGDTHHGGVGDPVGDTHHDPVGPVGDTHHSRGGVGDTHHGGVGDPVGDTHHDPVGDTHHSRWGTPTTHGVRTVIAIAAAAGELGLDLIAGGVESPEQLTVLRSCGFREAEGPLFSRALPKHAIDELLIENPFASLLDV